MDSASRERRKQQLSLVKEIKVSGFKQIPDSLISIYNEYNILAAASFDEQGSFIYELAVPLSALGLQEGGKEIAYNLKVNGLQFRGGGNFGGGPGGGFGGGQGGGFGGPPGGGAAPGSRGGFDPSAFLPTDFWGKYSLAKK